jgi:hypothetical protein
MRFADIAATPTPTLLQFIDFSPKRLQQFFNNSPTNLKIDKQIVVRVPVLFRFDSMCSIRGKQSKCATGQFCLCFRFLRLRL